MVIHRRSRAGCNTCRFRKVKCDELQPSCTPCQRGGRFCDWSQQWKFVNLNNSTASGYAIRNRANLDAFRAGHSRVADDDWNVAADYDTVDDSEADHGGRTSAVETDSDYPAPNRGPWTPVMAREVADARMIVYRDMSTPGASLDNTGRYIQLFDSYVMHKLTPAAVDVGIHLEDGKNIVVTLSETFSPLHHAICAITMLDMGLENSPDLIAASFKHYHEAINAGALSDPVHAQATFFLHWLLLMHDLGCAYSKWPDKRSSWTLHLGILAKLSQASSAMGAYSSYLSWYLVLIDCEATFSGYDRAGVFLTRMVEDGGTFPTWPMDRLYPASMTSSTERLQLAKVYQISLTVMRSAAALSLLAKRIRRDMVMGVSDVETRRRLVLDMSSKTDYDFHKVLLELFGVHTGDEFRRKMDPVFHGLFSLVELHQRIIKLYLHSSAYKGVRHECSEFIAESDVSCSHILGAISMIWSTTGKGNAPLVTCLFLVAFASRRAEEKEMALMYLRDVKEVGFLKSIGSIITLLERVVKAQAKAAADGLDPLDVDWWGGAQFEEIHALCLAVGESIQQQWYELV